MILFSPLFLMADVDPFLRLLSFINTKDARAAFFGMIVFLALIVPWLIIALNRCGGMLTNATATTPKKDIIVLTLNNSGGVKSEEVEKRYKDTSLAYFIVLMIFVGVIGWTLLGNALAHLPEMQPRMYGDTFEYPVFRPIANLFIGIVWLLFPIGLTNAAVCVFATIAGVFCLATGLIFKDYDEMMKKLTSNTSSPDAKNTYSFIKYQELERNFDIMTWILGLTVFFLVFYSLRAGTVEGFGRWLTPWVGDSTSVVRTSDSDFFGMFGRRRRR